MPVFPILKSESKVQVGDKIRFIASESFTSGPVGVVTKVEIEPEASAGFIDVYSSSTQYWYLDWAYATAGNKTVTLKITTLLLTVETETSATFTVGVVNSATDNLFSTDDEIKFYEPDLMNWLPKGYSSWNHVHRQAQRNILDWLDEIRLFKDDGSSWVPTDLVDKSQVRKLSLYMAMRMIFQSLSNQVGDTYEIKSNYYRDLENQAKNRNYLSLDLDSSGAITDDERSDLRTFTMVRR